MKLENIKDKIKVCLDRIYSEDEILFLRNKGKGLCERCLVFRFAYYLQNEFKEFFIDCDFNSSNKNEVERSGKPITNPDGRSSTNRFVDIIIHRRTFNRRNDFICFEVKKWNNSSGSSKDENNLRVLTSSYRYKYGFLIILGKTKDETEWSIWRKGQKIDGEVLVYQK